MEELMECKTSRSVGDMMQDLSSSGYDLLDKLSKRRQYVRSHVREKTMVMGLDPVAQSFSDSDVDELKISGFG